MSRFIALVLIALALSAGVYGAHAFGLGEGNRFGRLGAFKKPGASGPPPACSNSLIFTAACNSQYIPLL